jgi:hypothetical protein
MWRGGAVRRAFSTGIPAGGVVGALVLAESGLVAGAVAALIATGACAGTVTARRMCRLWPAAEGLSADERVAVVRAVRRGRVVDQGRLVPAALGYVDGLRACGDQARSRQWLVWLLAATMLALAVLDTRYGTTRIAALSWLFAAVLAAEAFWGPRARAGLLARAERSAESARRALHQQRVGD